jgi:hypothetical protein
MSHQRNQPRWYVEGDVTETVRRAREANAEPDELVSELARQEFDEIRPSRIEAIVDAIPNTDKNGGATTHTHPLSQSPATDAEPRPAIPRWLTLRDIAYLSAREAARVVGLALEQFEGTSVRPAINDPVECTLYWHRSRTTVGIRVVPMTGGPVEEDHVSALVDGPVNRSDGRSCSELAIVTNGWLSESASDRAAEEGIKSIDCGRLATLLKRARIPPTAAGTVFEDGENHDGPLSELVELPPIPAPQADDPFSLPPAFEADDQPADPDPTSSTPRTGGIARGTDGQRDGTRTENPLVTRQPSRGETGTLYADPSEDGEYAAFDRFITDLEHSESTGPSESSDRGKEHNI